MCNISLQLLYLGLQDLCIENYKNMHAKYVYYFKHHNINVEMYLQII